MDDFAEPYTPRSRGHGLKRPAGRGRVSPKCKISKPASSSQVADQPSKLPARPPEGTRASKKQRTKAHAPPTEIELNADLKARIRATDFVTKRPFQFDRASPLIVGADCAGLMPAETGLGMAPLKKRMVCAFASELDDKTRLVMVNNHRMSVLYGDITRRNVREAPRAHLYTAGPPCQPFSSEGLRGGMGDALGRGAVFCSVINYVEVQKPITFLIENVVGLAREHKALLDAILTYLGNLKDVAGNLAYDIAHTILDTKHMGLPQSRPRLYITGVMKRFKERVFTWPSPIPMKQLNDILLPDSGDAENLPPGMSSLRRYAHMLEFIKKDGGTNTDPWVGDVHSGRENRPSLGVVPCLTRSRCGTGGHWLFHKNRMHCTSRD